MPIKYPNLAFLGEKNGEYSSSLEAVQKIAEFLNVSSAYLLGETDNLNTQLMSELEAEQEALQIIAKLLVEFGIVFLDLEKQAYFLLEFYKFE